MPESGWYPPGAEHDPRAPYNQPEGEECANCKGSGLTNTETGEAASEGERLRLDVDECSYCDGTGVVAPPTKEEIEEARAEARFDQLHEEGLI